MLFKYYWLIYAFTSHFQVCNNLISLAIVEQFVLALWRRCYGSFFGTSEPTKSCLTWSAKDRLNCFKIKFFIFVIIEPISLKDCHCWKWCIYEAVTPALILFFPIYLLFSNFEQLDLEGIIQGEEHYLNHKLSI